MIRVCGARRGRSRLLAVTLLLAVCVTPTLGATEAVLYRIFLRDGGTLVSYGEYARVADRLVFTMPIGAGDERERLELVSIPDAAVDWEATSRYAEAVRARRYAETRGEDDFAMMSAAVAQALNEVALTDDPARRLAIADRARRRLAQFPAQNYGYRAADVAQLTTLLDEVVSELRVAAGQSRFDLDFVATTGPPPAVELLPAPSFRESIEQAFGVARLAPEAAARIGLLQAVRDILEKLSTQGSWASTLHARASATLAKEMRVEKAYADLTSRTLLAAEARLGKADVRGLESLIQDVLKADDRLGRQRPAETAALLAALDARLDSARRLRLAHDAWSLRLQGLRDYRRRIAGPLARIRDATGWLEDIRQLAGPTPQLVDRLERMAAGAGRELLTVTPPVELDAVHGTLGAAFQMAGRAATARRNAIATGDIRTAWDASSAAAGALMLFERALGDLDRLAAPPRPQ